MGPGTSQYLPNPARAIYVQGAIDAQLVYRVEREIIQLQAQSLNPITVYINSEGGLVTDCVNLIRHLQTVPSGYPPESERCRVITAVTGLAASAAARLLVQGDYALAHPWSRVYFHGGRLLGLEVTAEEAKRMNLSLRRLNTQTALEMAQRIFSRFVFRYQSSTESVIQQTLAGYCEGIQDGLSAAGRSVLDQSHNRAKRYGQLVNQTLNHRSIRSTSKQQNLSKIELEARILKALVDLQVKQNHDRDFLFSDEGWELLSEDATLVFEFVYEAGDSALPTELQMWAQYFLTKEELAALIAKHASTEEIYHVAKPRVAPLWTFVVALCHTLQSGEHDLTAFDAYWLGIVDEVIGSGLPCVRELVEKPA